MKPSDFYTKEAHSTAQKLPLFTPDGKETKEYLLVIGSDSDAVRKAKSLSMQKAMVLAKSNSMTDSTQDELALDIICAHVTGWSFKQKFSEEALREFLDNAPSVKDAVDVFGANSQNFIEKK